MQRCARNIFIDIPHHLTQWGNYRQPVFFTDDDYLSYLELLWQYSLLYRLEIWTYCLMPNHMHLIAVPHTEASCAHTLGVGHMRYAQYRHRQSHGGGHLRQGRIFSAPLDALDCSRAIRYVEMNPVRAGLVATPEAWPWSSAASHLSGLRLPGASFPSDEALLCWREFLQLEDPPGTVEIIRQCTAAGLPVGDAPFLTELEALAGRPLKWNPRGRPKQER